MILGCISGPISESNFMFRDIEHRDWSLCWEEVSDFWDPDCRPLQIYMDSGVPPKEKELLLADKGNGATTITLRDYLDAQGFLWSVRNQP